MQKKKITKIWNVTKNWHHTYTYQKNLHKKEMEHTDVKADMYSVLYTCM